MYYMIIYYMEKFEIFRDEKRIKTRINNDAIQCALKKNILFISRNLNEIAFRSVSCKWQFHSVERKRVVRDPFESLVSGLHRA